MRSLTFALALVTLTVVLGMAGVCAAQDLTICPRCAYECAVTNAVCTHCGAQLGKPAGSTPNAGSSSQTHAAASVPVFVVRVDGAVVDGEIASSEAALKSGDPWQAMFYCRNAMALNLLAAVDEVRAGRLLRLNKRCAKSLRAGGETCSLCGGTGETEQSTPSDGSVAGVTPCAACNGDGRLGGRINLTAIRSAYGMALQRYTVQRQSGQWVPVGNGWIPPSLDGKLDQRQRAILKRVTASRCAKCLGIGLTACESCRGKGRKKCDNKGCEDGYVTKKLDAFLDGGSHGTSPTTAKTNAQDRTLRVECNKCNGTGWVRCTDCGGRGGHVCATCSGSGERAQCAKCDGEGLVTCRRCSGSGTVKDKECSYCSGSGVLVCTSCNGDGRK